MPTSPRAPEPPVRRGRPRNAALDEAIHRATLELLGELGFDELTMGAIAARAGVGKATIYRRWPGKAAVVLAAVERLAAAAPPDPTGRTLRDDLLQIVTWLSVQIAEQDLGTLAAVLAGMRSDPTLAAAMRGRLRRDEASMIDRTLRRAEARGETVRPGADRLFAEVVPAVITHRMLIAGEPCGPGFLAHIVDDVLLGLLQGE